MKSKTFFLLISFSILLIFCNNIKSQNLNKIYKINLKSREYIPSKSLANIEVADQTVKNLIVQFNQTLTSDIINQLKELGIKINGQLSSTALSVYIEDKSKLRSIPDLRWIGKLEVSDKISGKLNKMDGELLVVINFHKASNPMFYNQELIYNGGTIIRSLTANDLLVRIEKSSLNKLAGIDGIAYIYPASRELINREKVYKCPGVMSKFGLVPEYVKQGEGWDGPGLGSAELKYHFVNGTPDVSGEQSEVGAALEMWSKYAQIDWTPTSSANQIRSFDISWGANEHGDGYPFDGPANVLAHCFYPDDSNPETIAGDMHFDEDESWRIGSELLTPHIYQVEFISVEFKPDHSIRLEK
jgi:hypothetical protein